ncbi:hypothetical protein BJ138DRAFT_435587 [Hygrophoropsis aurantiaca]|uniref:Uncharacterized protein n=1 Tax=Hygrophoropsis aurantiaca TaxID=72124 RepID=A0ACB8ANY5_9AGAM|nr:hypothetical protein BJ138DRAFT_435587 [Hygrophoropsis aurantiaca]
MPSTLKRSRRRELTLTRSFTNAIQSKIHPPDRPRPAVDIRARDVFLTDRTNTQASRQSSQAQLVPRNDRKFSLSIKRQRHPIHALPRELLGYIFLIESHGDFMLPVTMSHVCRSWRIIALHTPSLWRRVTLTPRLDMWAERIARAKSCLLDIELLPWSHPLSRPLFLDVNTVQWYMHLVAPHIGRCRSLRISFSNYAPYLWNGALSVCCRSDSSVYATNLEELVLNYEANDDAKEFTLFSGVAPRLRRVSLDGIRLTWLSSLFRNITYLDYTHRGFTKGHAAVYEVLHMLQVSNRLQDLRICFPSQKKEILYLPKHPLPEGVICMPDLMHLHLRVDGADIPSEMCSLLNQLTFPSLSSLNLIDLRRSPKPFARLSYFFQGIRLPYLSLKSLRLENGWFNARMTRSLIHAMYGLQQVEVQGASASELFVPGFTVRRWDQGGFFAERGA